MSPDLPEAEARVAALERQLAEDNALLDAADRELAETNRGMVVLYGELDDQAEQARIFDEFAQVDSPLQRTVKGTGLGLPDVTGFEVLERQKADTATRDIPVMVVTAQSLGARERERLARGAVAILSKLDSPVTMGRSIHAALDAAGVHPAPPAGASPSQVGYGAGSLLAAGARALRRAVQQSSRAASRAPCSGWDAVPRAEVARGQGQG